MSVRFQDPHCKGILNAVIYCSVLKGFTREKNAGKVWSVYEARQSACMSELFRREAFSLLTLQEMQKRNIDLSAVSSDILAVSRCAQQPVRE